MLFCDHTKETTLASFENTDAFATGIPLLEYCAEFPVRISIFNNFQSKLEFIQRQLCKQYEEQRKH